MLDLKLKDEMPCSEIRKRTKIIDIIEYTLKQKWKWAGHITRLKDNRLTRRCTDGSQGEGRGREDDQAEDGKMTKRRRREPPGLGKQQTDEDGRH